MKNLSRYLIAFVVVLIIGYLMWFFIDIVSYIVIAWVMSLIGQPMMNLLGKIRFGKIALGSSIRAILTILAFYIGFAMIIMLFAPMIMKQAQNLANVDYVAIGQSLETPIAALQYKLINLGLVNPEDDLVKFAQDKVFQFIGPQRVTGLFTSLLGFTSNFFMALFSITFITFFFLKDSGLFMQAVRGLSPTKYQEEVVNVVDRTRNLLTRYFGGVLIQITIITFYVTLLLSFFSVPNALLIGFFAALINVIPYLGPMIGAFFGVILAISANLDAEFYTEMLPMVFKVMGVFFTMQLLDNFILQPFIFSNSVKAHPLEIFIIILVGAKVGGILGMVLAIPSYTVIRVVASVFLKEFQVVQRITQRMNE